MLNAKPAITRRNTANLSFRKPAVKICLLILAGLVGVFVSAGRMQAQLPPMPKEKVVEVLGQHIHYHEAGEGKNIILLHGLGASADIWAANIPALSPHYHVVIPDQLGFGNSDKPPIEYKIQTWVEFLDLFMQALNIPKATVVGNSLGGWIAVDFARQHPEKVERLVLADAAGWRPINMPPPLVGSLNDASIAGIRQVLETMLFERRAIPVNLNPGSLQDTRKMLEFIVSDKQLITDQMVEQEFQRHLKIGDGYTVERFLAGSLAEDQFENEKIGNLTIPTMIVWGSDDRLFSLDEARAYYKAIHASKLVIIDHCGHVPQLEQSAAFNKALVDFLGGS
jgi:pimeloyl-ACP methyl ester carboxylesterase